MENLSIGDAVQLKSGGPIMTVESIDQEGVNCVWFVDETSALLQRYFTLETVKKIESKK